MRPGPMCVRTSTSRASRPGLSASRSPRPTPRAVRSWLFRTRSIRVAADEPRKPLRHRRPRALSPHAVLVPPAHDRSRARRMGARGNGGGYGEPGLPRPGRHRLVAATSTLVRGAAAERDEPDLRVAAALALSRRASAAAASCVPHGERASARRRKRWQASSRRTSGSRREPFAAAFGRFAVWTADWYGDQLKPLRRLARGGDSGGSVSPLAIHYLRLSRSTRLDIAPLHPQPRRGGSHVSGRERSPGRPGRVPPAPRPPRDGGRELTYAIPEPLRRSVRFEALTLVVANGDAARRVTYRVATR